MGKKVIILETGATTALKLHTIGAVQSTQIYWVKLASLMNTNKTFKAAVGIYDPRLCPGPSLLRSVHYVPVSPLVLNHA